MLGLEFQGENQVAHQQRFSLCQTPPASVSIYSSNCTPLGRSQIREQGKVVKILLLEASAVTTKLHEHRSTRRLSEHVFLSVRQRPRIARLLRAQQPGGGGGMRLQYKLKKRERCGEMDGSTGLGEKEGNRIEVQKKNNND